MSDNGPEWFAPKRYGYGSGLPVAWQGWAVTAAFLGLAFAVSVWFNDRPLVMLALMGPATAVFLTIVAKTTRGGWRWRWGDDD
ncbi:MAG: hypothetical protein JOZ20_05150 [Sphingomonas sp.]|nr:hypothetical protein [Sphingomonas sp.]MBW0007070.1 hypothetical protein [Sphingomonas sp.]